MSSYLFSGRFTPKIIAGTWGFFLFSIAQNTIIIYQNMDVTSGSIDLRREAKVLNAEAGS